MDSHNIIDHIALVIGRDETSNGRILYVLRCKFHELTRIFVLPTHTLRVMDVSGRLHFEPRRQSGASVVPNM